MPVFGVRTRPKIRSGVVLAIVALAAGAVLASAPPALAAPAGPSPQVVTFSGDGTWTVPSGVTSIDVTLVGGAGGGSIRFMNVAQGGRGSLITGTLSVTPGEVWQMNVGAAGLDDRYGGPGASAGGEGGYGGYCGTGGGGGGGSTGIAQAWNTNYYFMVAAGGGGGGGQVSGLVGGTGGDGDVDNAQPGGSHPGAMGVGGTSNGGPGDHSSSCDGGGGGGGGWDPSGKGGGDGGGADHNQTGGGGGGGRSWIDPSVLNPVIGAHGDFGENGSVTISYVLPPTATVSLATSTLTAAPGAAISVDASVQSSSGQIPVGTVNLVSTSTPATILATGTLDSSGRASLTFAAQQIGVSTARLEFVPTDPTAFPPSVSPDLTITVIAASTSVAAPAPLIPPGIAGPGSSPALTADRERTVRSGPTALAASGADVTPAAVIGAASVLAGLALMLAATWRRPIRSR